jgi:autotransporter-associated beta strand protein
LARTSALTASQFIVGGSGSANIASTSSGAVEMGQATTIHADTIKVGLGRNQGSLSFAGGSSNPTLTVRATDGVSRVPVLNVGEINSGGQSFTRVCTIDTSAGTLDALVDAMIIGNNNRGNGADTNNDSRFLMGAGVLDANSITLGQDKTGATGAQISSGTLTIQGGTVKVGNLLLGNRFATLVVSATVNLNGGGVLAAQSITAGTGAATRTINWNDGTIRNYDSATDLTVGAGISTVTLAATGLHAFEIGEGRTGTVNQAISGSGALTKSGAGRLVLAAANSYSGGTTVTTGTLLVNNAGGSGAGTGAVSVQNSSTLGGIGACSGTVTVAAGATLAPGDNGVGTLATGPAVLAGAYQCQLDGAAADKLAVTGNLDLTGASLAVANLNPPSAGSYVIATYTGTRTGTFATVPAGYTVDYSTPNQVKLTVGGGGFASWIAGYGLTGSNALPTADPDFDGLDNAVEFVVGGNPASGMDAALLPTVTLVTNPGGTVPDGSYLKFTYRRTPASAYLNPGMEYDADLTGAWTAAAGAPGAVQVVTPGFYTTPTPADKVDVYVPRAANQVNGKLFGRLRVTVP